MAPLLLVGLACSSSEEDATSSNDGSDLGKDNSKNKSKDADDPVSTKGSGSATITIGSETWTFESVACAMGEAQIGVEGAEFNASAQKGKIALYVNVEDGRNYIELNDLETMDDGGLNWSTVAIDQADPAIAVSEKKATSTATFFSQATDGSTSSAEGTVEVNCP